MTKSETRALIREKKSGMTKHQIQEKSSLIMKRLYDTDVFRASSSILTYVSYNQEVETLDLIKNCIMKGKKVYVPKVYGKEMHFHRLNSVDELKPGRFGILEPDNTLLEDPDEGLMIMPGLAFDYEFHRIGYGGGYYDRYLSEHIRLIKAAICFEFQMLEHIETEPHDLQPELIITEQTTYMKHQN